MPDTSFYGPNAVVRPASTRSRGYRYLSVDFASRRVTHEFKLSGVQYGWERNTPGSFSAAIDLYDDAAKFLRPQETFIVVERRGLPFWCGFLWQPTRSGSVLQIGAQEVFSIFGHRHIRETQTWELADRAKIVRDLMSYAQQGLGGDIGLRIGSELVGGEPFSYSVPWWENKNVLEVIDTIVSMDPTFTFRVEGEWLPGNRLGFVLVIEKHPVATPHKLIYGANVDEYEWSPLSPSPNFVDAFGGFDNAAMIRRSAQNDDALLRQPRIEGSVENRAILVEEPVVKLATNQLKRLSGSPSQPTVTMQADSDPELGILRPGHSAEVLIKDGYVEVSGVFNVAKIEVDVPDGAADAPGAEKVSIEFESKIDDAAVSTA